MGKTVNHIGEIKTMICGEPVTITGKADKRDYYRMRTSDGFEFEGSYHNFKKGTINPDRYKDHLGETRTMNCGEAVTIIGKAEKENYYKMRTSDGFEFESSYQTFKRGTINPDLHKGHIGETKIMNCGLYARCTKYEISRNITIRFEDGYTKSNVRYSNFYRECIIHPDLDIKNKNRNFHGYKIIGNRVSINGDVYYNAIRLSDGEKVYMTPQMMMAAEKEEKSHGN